MGKCCLSLARGKWRRLFTTSTAGRTSWVAAASGDARTQIGSGWEGGRRSSSSSSATSRGRERDKQETAAIAAQQPGPGIQPAPTGTQQQRRRTAPATAEAGGPPTPRTGSHAAGERRETDVDLTSTMLPPEASSGSASSGNNNSSKGSTAPSPTMPTHPLATRRGRLGGDLTGRCRLLEPRGGLLLPA